LLASAGATSGEVVPLAAGPGCSETGTSVEKV